MSAKTINLYNERLRRTEPPPGGATYAEGLRKHIKELRDAAARILANANELEHMANKLEGK